LYSEGVGDPLVRGIGLPVDAEVPGELGHALNLR
jgi:hypothetical protein